VNASDPSSGAPGGTPAVTVIGAGLAGCEAALGLARRGIRVRLIEQKPGARTPAQHSDALCELVCSNSLRGAALTNAVGLLKEEMRRLGSFVMQAADATRVPAGGALAVDREQFSSAITRRIADEPLVELVCDQIERLPDARPLIVATGPLTGDALASDLEARLGRAGMAYYDAIAPIVAADSIDRDRVFRASRWDKGESDEERSAYVNCPLYQAQYARFVTDLVEARKVAPRPFEQIRYFEGCLPIEVMAERGEQTLAFGPMKPVGLVDPRTGRRPHAVVQLRAEDAAQTAFNLVGFQTRLTQPEQARIFRTIPGLEQAEFLRWGAVHRNTFIDSPRLLDGTLQLRAEPGVYFAGQITGTEGYVESAACGWLAAHFLEARLAGRVPTSPPETTAHGGLLAHLSRRVEDFQPSNVNFSLLAPWAGPRLRKRARYQAMADRALADLDAWLRLAGVTDRE
jgi:methylenetetrahydrofolate--tRNA-(uracil-5-)-methyltransferase